MGGEAEHVIVVLVFVSQAVVSDARRHVLSTAGFTRVGDGILNRAVAQPPGVAPVQFPSPRVVQLIERSHHGVLIPARPLSVVEVQVVAAEARVVREDDTWRGDRMCVSKK